jgi:hypothetical protein
MRSPYTAILGAGLLAAAGSAILSHSAPSPRPKSDPACDAERIRRAEQKRARKAAALQPKGIGE